MDTRPTLAFVIPVYNEETIIPEFYRRLEIFAPQLVNQMGGTLQYIFVDDGSTDGSLDRLRAMAARDPRCKVIALSRNWGAARAIAVGLTHAHAQAVITMAADLQDPPELLPDVIAKWREGADVVWAVPDRQSHSMGARAKIMRSLEQVTPVDFEAGDFRLLTARAVAAVLRGLDAQGSVAGALGAIGFRQVRVPYERPPRMGGSRTSTLQKIARTMTLAIAYTKLPLRLAMLFGMAAMVLAMLFGLGVGIGWIFGGAPSVVVLLFVWVAFATGLQLFFVGLVGEYVARVFEEVRKPGPFVSEIIGGSANRPSAAPSPMSVPPPQLTPMAGDVRGPSAPPPPAMPSAIPSAPPPPNLATGFLNATADTMLAQRPDLSEVRGPSKPPELRGQVDLRGPSKPPDFRGQADPRGPSKPPDLRGPSKPPPVPGPAVPGNSLPGGPSLPGPSAKTIRQRTIAGIAPEKKTENKDG